MAMHKFDSFPASHSHCLKASQASIAPARLLRNSRSFNEFKGPLVQKVGATREPQMP